MLLDQLVDERPGPEARYEASESISLAFVTALQLLPSRQRAALILRDVLGYRAAEAAQMLDATPESVQSALKRARADAWTAPARAGRPPAARSAPEERALLDRFVAAFTEPRRRRARRADDR